MHAVVFPTFPALPYIDMVGHRGPFCSQPPGSPGAAHVPLKHGNPFERSTASSSNTRKCNLGFFSFLFFLLCSGFFLFYFLFFLMLKHSFCENSFKDGLVLTIRSLLCINILMPLCFLQCLSLVADSLALQAIETCCI